MDLLTLIARIKLETKEYQNNLNKSEQLAQKTSKKIGNFFKVAGVGATAIGAGLVAFGKKSVEAGMEFDKSMSQVAATMGVTVDEIQDLRDYAQEMGRTTAFSATEASEALNYMALAGYDAQTSMKMLPNVLNLAAAGNIDLAEASDMVTDAQSALSLSLEETNEMVDKMAKASSKSNTSVQQLGQAFLTIGGTAKNLKGGTTELSTALGLLADNGIKGAEGGTALRNILLSLTPKSEDAAKAMEQIGLQAYDANGNMRPLKDIFSDMNKAMEPMTQQERTEILSNIFNKVDLKSVNALLATNVDRWDELTVAIDDSQGAAQAMAETQLDNLQGSVTLFKSALEGAYIALSDKLSPNLKNFVDWATDKVSILTEGFGENGLKGALDKVIPPSLQTGLKVLATLIAGVTGGLAAYNAVQAIKAALNWTEGASLGPLIAAKIADAAATWAMIAPYIAVGVAIAAIIAIIVLCVKHWDKIKAKTIEVANKIKESVSNMKDKVVGKIKDLINSIKSKFDELKNKAKNWGKDFLQNFINGITAKIQALRKKVQDVAKTVSDFLHHTTPEKGPLANDDEWGGDFVDNFVQGIDSGKSRLANSVEGLAGTMADSFGYDNYFTTGSNDSTQTLEISFSNSGNQALTQLARALFPYMQIVSKEKGVTVSYA